MLREQTTALINAITPCLDKVATALQQKDLISQDVIGEILPKTCVPSIKRARQLVTYLQLSLKGHPSPDKYLIDVCQVLCSQGDNALRKVAISIKQNLGK